MRQKFASLYVIKYKNSLTRQINRQTNKKLFAIKILNFRTLKRDKQIYINLNYAQEIN